ncbi:bifunctional riboflavin kinase/FMN adenylyltransferase [Verrucomicrobia bacterium LW23]|nr:bifunctional riboflavin kinase/FMN adenylyltransferase [Verrucomicrobia bacterium LW23]
MHTTTGDSVALSEIPSRPDIRHVAIGMFDGVHVGHRAVVGELMRCAGCAGTAPASTTVAAEGMAVMTFEPHPLSVIAPDRAPPRLTTPGQRRKLLAQAGAREVIAVSFTPRTRDLSSAEFIDELERIFPALRTIVVGPGWTFGRDRSGNALVLNQRGRGRGYQVLEVAPVMAGGVPISSTRIREAIAAGNLALAREFLGRPHMLTGTVIHGRQNGRKIGFPTANLGGVFQMLPPNGVYASRTFVHGHLFAHGPSHAQVPETIGTVLHSASARPASIASVTNIGIRPTLNDGSALSVETHLFDFVQDIYGKEIEVALEYYLRPEKRFADLEALQAQIRKDEEEARRLLQFVGR